MLATSALMSVQRIFARITRSRPDADPICSWTPTCACPDCGPPTRWWRTMWTPPPLRSWPDMWLGALATGPGANLTSARTCRRWGTPWRTGQPGRRRWPPWRRYSDRTHGDSGAVSWCAWPTSAFWWPGHVPGPGMPKIAWRWACVWTHWGCRDPRNRGQRPSRARTPGPGHRTGSSERSSWRTCACRRAGSPVPDRIAAAARDRRRAAGRPPRPQRRRSRRR